MIDIKPFVDILNKSIEENDSLTQEQKKRIIAINNSKPEAFEQNDKGEWVKVE